MLHLHSSCMVNVQHQEHTFITRLQSRPTQISPHLPSKEIYYLEEHLPNMNLIVTRRTFSQHESSCLFSYETNFQCLYSYSILCLESKVITTKISQLIDLDWIII
jgi:hypothetical protein